MVYSIFPGVRVFSNELALHIRWPKYWSFSFSISLSNEYPGLISLRMDWLDLLAVQGTLKSLLQHHTILYLGFLPLLAYPLQSVTPHFKDKGRDGQRTLAMLFAVAGYIFCLVTNILASASAGMWIICLEYLLSGVLILVFNKGFHIKLSAHGCGSAGPIFLLLYFGLYLPAALMAVVTVLAYVASVKAKHHTVPQLIGGSAVSISILFALTCIL